MSEASQIIVVYDANTGQIGMTVIPDYDSQIPDILTRAAIDFPTGVIVSVPVNSLVKSSFQEALAQVAPDAVIDPPDALDALVAAALK